MKEMTKEELSAHMYYVLDTQKMKDFLEYMRMAYVPDMHMVGIINLVPTALDYTVYSHKVPASWASAWIKHLADGFNREAYDEFHASMRDIRWGAESKSFPQLADEVEQLILVKYEATKDTGFGGTNGKDTSAVSCEGCSSGDGQGPRSQAELAELIHADCIRVQQAAKARDSAGE